MDDVSRIRFKNLLESIIHFCDEAKTEKEKKILLRIGVIILHKLRMHSNADPLLGQEVRELKQKIINAPPEKMLCGTWDDMLDLLFYYKKDLSNKPS